MAKDVYRAKSLERISSPEQLNDYLRVTRPSVWVALAAVILLFIGAFIWSAQVHISSYVNGVVQVQDGSLIMTFENSNFTQFVQPGLDVQVGQVSMTITSVGRNEDGQLFAHANTTLADGIYPATVSYKQTQILKLLFDGNVAE